MLFRSTMGLICSAVEVDFSGGGYILELRRPWGFSPEARRGSQGGLAWAQSIYLVRKLDVYSRSVKSEISLPGKYYVTDVGLRSAVIPLQSDDDGKRLENTVYLELLRRKSHNEELSYFDGAGECDFVVSEGDVAKRLVQVTWDMADVETRGREFSGLLKAAHATGCRDLVIVTRDEEGEEIHDGMTVRIVPVCKFLLSK